MFWIIFYVVGAFSTSIFCIYQLYKECQKGMVDRNDFTDSLFEIFVFGFILWFIFASVILIDFLTDKLYNLFTAKK